MLDEGSPLFEQIAELVAADIAAGVLAEGDRVPSSNEFAAFHRVNPATAAKGIARLVDDGLLEKRRGVGMFVAPGARERLVARRRAAFRADYVTPLLAEAERLGIDPASVIAMITDSDRLERSTS